MDKNIIDRIDEATHNPKTLKKDLLKLLKETKWILWNSVQLAYEDEVVSTGMESLIIGGERGEYADKADWIDGHLMELDTSRGEG